MVATMTNPLGVGLRQERVIAPQCLVIFGASGDLTHRKLVPALFANGADPGAAGQ